MRLLSRYWSPKHKAYMVALYEKDDGEFIVEAAGQKDSGPYWDYLYARSVYENKVLKLQQEDEKCQIPRSTVSVTKT